MNKLIFAVLMLTPGLVCAQKYALRDEGEFQALGQPVEFYDRFGWRSYKAEFDFGLDEQGRALSKDSRLALSIVKRDGSRWDYACKAWGRRPLNANVNFVYGKGISVVVDCRIEGKSFAKAVELDPEDVGAPSLVFHALIRDGKVFAGAQRGIYFAAGAQIAALELSPYAVANNDPSSLAVVFQSASTLQ